MAIGPGNQCRMSRAKLLLSSLLLLSLPEEGGNVLAWFFLSLWLCVCLLSRLQNLFTCVICFCSESDDWRYAPIVSDWNCADSIHGTCYYVMISLLAGRPRENRCILQWHGDTDIETSTTWCVVLDTTRLLWLHDVSDAECYQHLSSSSRLRLEVHYVDFSWICSTSRTTTSCAACWHAMLFIRCRYGFLLCNLLSICRTATNPQQTAASGVWTWHSAEPRLSSGSSPSTQHLGYR